MTSALSISTSSISKAADRRRRATQALLVRALRSHSTCCARGTFGYSAIDRCSRSVHLAVKNDETEKSAIAFLREAAAVFPFRLTHALTDNGSCFTPAFAKACTDLKAQYRHTKPRTPQTNGMVERSNGRIASEVLSINIYSHRTLEQLLRGFNQAYNARRQLVLDGGVAEGSTCAARGRATEVGHQTKSPPSDSRSDHDALTLHRVATQAPATPPKHVSSLKLPRRSHNQTSRSRSPFIAARNASASTSMAWANRRRAPLRRTAVSGSSTVSG